MSPTWSTHTKNLIPVLYFQLWGQFGSSSYIKTLRRARYKTQEFAPHMKFSLLQIQGNQTAVCVKHSPVKGKLLPLRRAAWKRNKKRIVAREPLPVFAMLDTCFSMAEQPERGSFTYSYSGTRLMRCGKGRALSPFNLMLLSNINPATWIKSYIPQLIKLQKLKRFWVLLSVRAAGVVRGEVCVRVRLGVCACVMKLDGSHYHDGDTVLVQSWDEWAPFWWNTVYFGDF